MITESVLKNFLGKDSLHETPYYDHEFTYYTDGFVILRIPSTDSKTELTTEEKSIIKRIKSLPWQNNKELFPEWVSLPKDVEIKQEICSRCNGTGKEMTCPECEGLGYVSWETEKHIYEAECLECNGLGYLLPTIVEDDRLLECSECKGKGKIDKIEIALEVAGVSLSNVMVKKLSLLPNVKILAKEIGYEILYFSFDDNCDGLVMGYIPGNSVSAVSK